MDSINLINQNIITKDQKSNYIFKLTHGTAKIINQNEQTVKTIQAPCFLNLVQCLQSVPSLKTVQAIGKCQVKKIIMRESHKSFLKDLKQRGVRKSKLKVFQQIHSSKFYQLIRLGSIIQLRKSQQFIVKNQYFYFTVKGSIIASEKCSKFKMFRMQQGSIWCGKQNEISFRSEVDQTRIIQVSASIVYCILQQKENQLINLIKYQNQTLQNFKLRNERVGQHIKRSDSKHFTKIVMQKNFANSIQFRYSNKNSINKLKTKSCYLLDNGQLKKPREIIEEIKKDNKNKFMQLMQINKRKYKRNNLRSQSIDSFQSISYTATPQTHSLSCKCKPTNLDIVNSNCNKVTNKENYHSFNQIQFSQIICKILNRKQNPQLKKRTYSRNKAKLTFPMGTSRKKSTEQLTQLKLT